MEFSLVTTQNKEADEWELDPSQVFIEEQLGEGAFGDVYRGNIKRTTGTHSANTSMAVAIKLLKGMESLHSPCLSTSI